MKVLCWDYYNGYYYKDVKRKTLTKEEEKILVLIKEGGKPCKTNSKKQEN